jgi:hypothetical protein
MPFFSMAAGRIAGTTTSDATIEKYAAAGVRCFLTGIGSWIDAGATEFIRRAESAKR